MFKKMGNASLKAWSKAGTQLGTTAGCAAATCLTGGAGAAFIAVGATTSFASNVADKAVDYAWGTCSHCGNPLKENNEWTICASTQKEHKKQNFKNMDWGDAIGDGLAGGFGKFCKGPTKNSKMKKDMAKAEKKVNEKVHALEEHKKLVDAEYDLMTRKTFCQKFKEEIKPFKPLTDARDMYMKKRWFEDDWRMKKPRPAKLKKKFMRMPKVDDLETVGKYKLAKPGAKKLGGIIHKAMSNDSDNSDGKP